MNKVKKHINLFSPHGRLEKARIDAGFSTSLDASRHFDWEVGTLRRHESGELKISQQWAEKYASAFRINLQYLLMESIHSNVGETMKHTRLIDKKKRPRKKREHLIQVRVDLDEETDLVELKIHKWLPFEDAIKIIDIIKMEH